MAGTPLRVLVAEDDPVSRRLTQRALEEFGHVVLLAEDGLEAWQRFEADGADLVISDWMMPGLDGPELCRRIRAAQGRPFCYVLLLTSRHSREDRVQAAMAGADDFMVKPFDRELLRARLHAAERIVRLERVLAARIRELEEALGEARRLRERRET